MKKGVGGQATQREIIIFIDRHDPHFVSFSQYLRKAKLVSCMQAIAGKQQAIAQTYLLFSRLKELFGGCKPGTDSFRLVFMRI